MTFAKTALMFALMLPAMAQAQGVIDTHFNAGSCFLRNYGPSHLASHPDQLVRSILLAPVPLEAPKGTLLFNLMVNLRGSDDYPSGIAYCNATGKIMACQMEGDAGSFTLTAQDRNALLLTVGKFGIVLEGQDNIITISGTSGDDRAFLLGNVSTAFCN